MISSEERVSLVGEFSTQVQRHFSANVYRSLFVDRTGVAQFGTANRTLVCIECPESGPLTRDGLLEKLSGPAATYGGRIDPCSQNYLLLSFRTPQAALQLTLSLLRSIPRARLRMGITTGPCKVVQAKAEGQEFLVLLGKERARAESFAARAAAGTVQMAQDTYDALGDCLSDDFGSFLVMVESEDGSSKDITLTLPPGVSAGLSTFVGLGRA